MTRLEQVVEFFGGRNRLAGHLDVSSVAVHWWLKENKLPPLRAIQIEELSGGKFKASELLGGENE